LCIDKKYFMRTVGLLALSMLLLISCKKSSSDTSANTGGVPQGPIRPVTANSNTYVTSFFDYNPAPGQYINTSIGTDSAANAVLGNAHALVSLGAFGGYVIYGFDHTVLNKAGYDILVVGNATPTFSESGVVWVMTDANGNGKPDDTWYEIAGSQTDSPGYKRNYSVTYYKPTPPNGSVQWQDNLGDTGLVLTNLYHTQDYYPENIASSYVTFTGTLIPDVNIDTSNASLVISLPFKYGYCDNTAGGDSIDIATAIDSTGKTVVLKGIDFIKIQTGIQYNMKWLGEQSTEVSAIADISLLK
jgi:hypothetical protein